MTWAVVVVVRSAGAAEVVRTAGFRIADCRTEIVQTVATADFGARIIVVLAVDIPVARIVVRRGSSDPSRSLVASSQKFASVGYPASRLV